MRPPAFWNGAPQAPGLWPNLLRPLAMMTAVVTARRVAKAGYHAHVPVICVGNLNLGGTGKTPTVIALAQSLTHRGKTPHIVSRGYGGRMSGPAQVDPARHKAEDVGDEPLLLAAFAPTWVAKDRAAGVRSAEHAGANVIVLDDGFQNPSVAKDLSIVVVDAAIGFGNGLCLPAGPLREPVQPGLARADLLISIGNSAAQSLFDARWGELVTVPHQRATLAPLKMGMDLAGERIMAFAGIGHPEKFFATLRSLGADLVRTIALADHQPLGIALLQRLQSEAAALGAQLVTTEKDAVRLPEAFRLQVLTVPVRLTFEVPALLEDALTALLAQRPLSGQA